MRKIERNEKVMRQTLRAIGVIDDLIEKEKRNYKREEV